MLHSWYTSSFCHLRSAIQIQSLAVLFDYSPLYLNYKNKEIDQL